MDIFSTKDNIQSIQKSIKNTVSGYMDNHMSRKVSDNLQEEIS